MTSIESSFVSPPNPQEDSVFFTLFPKEIGDEIFDLAITPYEKREEFLPEDLEYNRPGFSQQLSQNLNCFLADMSTNLWRDLRYFSSQLHQDRLVFWFRR